MAPANEADRPPILEVRNVSVRFGGVQALEGVSLEVPERGFVGLIGPNGAGKTTLFNCVSGFVRPQTGEVLFGGRPVTRVPSFRRALGGVGRTFQNVGLCKGETVYTNVLIAQHREVGYGSVPGMFGIGVRRREESLARRADELLDALDLLPYRNAVVRDLPVGIAKLVELACVLSSDPVLLLLDEPSSGLGPEESERLRDILLRFHQEMALSVLMVGHDVRLVMSTAQYIYVLNFGKLLAQGPPEAIRRDPAVVEAYLGREAKVGGRR